MVSRSAFGPVGDWTQGPPTVALLGLALALGGCISPADVELLPDKPGPGGSDLGRSEFDDAGVEGSLPDAGDGLAAFGEPCLGGGECASGYCVEPGLCTRACADDDCPVGFACRVYGVTGPDVSQVCLPTRAGTCAPCTLDDDCAAIAHNEEATRCLKSPAGSFGCLAFCDGPEDCQAGTECQTVAGDDYRVCAPAGGCHGDGGGEGEGEGLRECLPGREDACPGGLEEGQCRPGTRTCSAAGRWMDCVGRVEPMMELCNGLDDDCDGDTDEDAHDVGAACGNDTPPCAPGRFVCRLGVLACEGGILPQEEVCDGVDNDCNGTVDDDIQLPEEPCGSSQGECSPGRWRCVDGQATCFGGRQPEPEVCNGLDDDCNGLPDDGLGVCECQAGERRPCGTDQGSCEPGEQRCAAGRWGACEGGRGPQAELCNGLDDDCDGEVDEDFPTLGQRCGSAQGVCRPGRLACTEEGLLGCLGGIQGTPEVCNGQDDDCDGEVDEGIACGHELRIRYELPAGAVAVRLRGDLGPGEAVVDLPIPAGPEVEHSSNGVASGLRWFEVRWVDPLGVPRSACERTAAGSPLLSAGLPRVWQDGVRRSVSLRQGPDGSYRFVVELGRHSADPIWWDGAHRLGIRGTVLATPCAVAGSGGWGWWAGPVARRDAAGDFVLDLSAGGWPAGRFSLNLWGVDCPADDYLAWVSRMEDFPGFDQTHPSWQVPPADFPPLARTWLRSEPEEPGPAVTVLADGRGNLLPGGNLDEEGLRDPRVTEDHFCAEADQVACRAGNLEGISLCAGGVWQRCTGAAGPYPAERLGDGQDDDGDGFVDEDRGNLILNGGFEQGLVAPWRGNDLLPFPGVAGADGQGFVAASLGGAAQGERSVLLAVDRVARVPEPASWHLQAIAGGIRLRAGARYRLLLRARADSAHRLSVEVAAAEEPYQSVGLYVGDPNQYLVLGPRWSTRSLTFVAMRDCAACNLTLSAGLDPGQVWIDDVTLTELP